MVSGLHGLRIMQVWASCSLPFPNHRPRSAGRAWARLPRHARTACICKDTHCLAFKFHGGSTHLLLQAHPCPGSSATFSNPGKKSCGRFGLALFFWVVLFGFKLGAVQHALTSCSRCTACPGGSATFKQPVKKKCAPFGFAGFFDVRVVWVQARSSATGLN